MAPNTTATAPAAAPDLAEMVTAGTDALNDGDLRLALERFEAVVNTFPHRPEGHNNPGALYSSLGEYEKAETCFDHVLDLLPENPNVRYNRGLVRSRQEKHDAARDDFQAVLKLTPNDPDTLNNLGVSDFMQGRLDEARRHFETALKVRPGYANAFLNLVDLAWQTDGADRAARMCGEFLASHHDTEVQRRHLELQISAAREHLQGALVAADAVMVVDANPVVAAERERIVHALAAWHREASAHG